MTTTFGLLRHGQTKWNFEKRIQGSGDSPLTPEGILATKEWGLFLTKQRWNRIVSSPLGRTRQTSEIINSYLSIPVEFKEALREQHWGDWEGINKQELKKNHQTELNKQVNKGWDFRPPNGESRAEVLERAKATLFQLAHKHPSEKILIICHQGVIKSILYHLLGRKFLPQEPKVLIPRTLHTISVSNSSMHIEKLNINNK